MNTQAAVTIILVAVVGLAAYLDARTGRIPNVLTVPAVVVGMILMTLGQGTAGLVSSLEGIGMALALWMLTGLVGGSLGGGDIKLLAAVGALSGPLFLLYVIVATAFVGGVWACVAAMRRGLLLDSLRRLYTGIWCAAILKRPKQLTSQSANLHIPYAPAIAGGTVIALLWRTV